MPSDKVSITSRQAIPQFNTSHHKQRFPDIQPKFLFSVTSLPPTTCTIHSLSQILEDHKLCYQAETVLSYFGTNKSVRTIGFCHLNKESTLYSLHPNPIFSLHYTNVRSCLWAMPLHKLGSKLKSIQ